ncbi:MAG TPA: C13 family peptidase [Burkholderiales bacterium]|nr:C13 family peptidase [Burkholderiales bacterium]
MLDRTMRAALALSFLWLATTPAAFAAGKPDAVTPDGGRYYGPLAGGKLHGRGRIEWPSGSYYEGEFADGMMAGKGEARYRDGRAYRGEFALGEFDGKGRFQSANGDVYEGDFKRGEFTGSGRFTRKDGGHYEGEFRNWLFHGQGKLRLKNGDLYEGAFANGFYEGQGTLTYARPRPDGRKQDSGTWRFGSLPQDAERRQERKNVEVALYAQKELLDQALASLQPRAPGKINLYLLTVAGDASQEVFRREVDFVQREFARRFGTAGRSISLINSRNTAASAPMATLTSIRRAVKAIAARMDREHDILFMFLTSHGSREHELTLDQNGMELADLGAAELGALLKESGIRWKVVVVSACYSGGFIEPLKDGRTLVMTAARHDRRSFGCADENDFTYFGRAFFKESLPRSRSFVEAFRRAEALVSDWERKDASRPASSRNAAANAADEHHSLPQIANAVAIDEHLKRWWAQTPPDRPAGAPGPL